MQAPQATLDISPYTQVDSTTYRTGLDGNKVLFARGHGARFAVHEMVSATPGVGAADMTVVIEPGDVLDQASATQTEMGGITTCTSVSGNAVASNLAIDEGVSNGMLAISPSYPSGTYVTDASSLSSGSVTLSNNATISNSNVPIRFVQRIGGTYAGNIHTNNVVDNLPSTANLFVGMAASSAHITGGQTIASIVSATSIHLSGVSTATTTENITFTIPPPVTNPRIDLIVINGSGLSSPGAAQWVKGTEAASPSAPAIPSGTAPAAKIKLATSTTAITNATCIKEKRSLSFLAAVGKSSFVTTSTVTMATGTSHGENHGLGTLPSTFTLRCWAKCVTAEGGYSVGDVIALGNYVENGNARGMIAWANNTQVGFTTGAQSVTAQRKDTGATFNLTAANWNGFAAITYGA